MGPSTGILRDAGGERTVALQDATRHSVLALTDETLALGAEVELILKGTPIRGTVAWVSQSPEGIVIAFDEQDLDRMAILLEPAANDPKMVGPLLARSRTKSEIHRGPPTNLPTASLSPNADGSADVIFEPVEGRSEPTGDTVVAFKRGPDKDS